MSGSSPIKRWPGWLVLFMVLAALLAIGVQRAGQPRTADEREQAIYERLACPVCDGESVVESRAESAVQIREVVAQLVVAGQLTDDEIVTQIDASYVEELALTPGRSGLDLLVWVLPAVAFVGAVAGLIAVFLRWQRTPRAAAPNDEDRAIDPTYPDAQCFTAIVRFRFAGDAEGAKEPLERCRAGDLPASVQGLVDALGSSIDDALAENGDATATTATP